MRKFGNSSLSPVSHETDCEKSKVGELNFWYIVVIGYSNGGNSLAELLIFCGCFVSEHFFNAIMHVVRVLGVTVVHFPGE